MADAKPEAHESHVQSYFRKIIKQWKEKEMSPEEKQDILRKQSRLLKDLSKIADSMQKVGAYLQNSQPNLIPPDIDGLLSRQKYAMIDIKKASAKILDSINTNEVHNDY